MSISGSLISAADLTWYVPEGVVVLPDAAKGRVGVQGLACSADGQILALGASLTTGRSVLLYREGNWQLVPNPGGATYFGFSIAMSADGNRVAVGCMSGDAPLDKGAVFLYQWDAATSAYVASQTVTPDAGSAANANFGESLHLSRDGARLVVGARTGNYAAVYDWSAATADFALTATLTSPNGSGANRYYGDSVLALDDGSVVVAESGFGTSPRGRVYRYVPDADTGVLTLAQTLLANGKISAISSAYGNFLAGRSDGTELMVSDTEYVTSTTPGMLGSGMVYLHAPASSL